MKNLILDGLGALSFAVLGYYHQRGKINLISKYIIKHDSKQPASDPNHNQSISA
ncbi:hypothetical protein [Anaerosolibacter carboniphilus]|uniref:hypothetical protein n=1 Tax=Anaerosolibacter carboniphilus TaxID=1417629 RepID=UPI001A9C0031|nr:hypothetical protein [Anaerosolibacter carboniphilus]